jgi:hypothetical protein
MIGQHPGQMERISGWAEVDQSKHAAFTLSFRTRPNGKAEPRRRVDGNTTLDKSTGKIKKAAIQRAPKALTAPATGWAATYGFRIRKLQCSIPSESLNDFT